MAKPPSKIV